MKKTILFLAVIMTINVISQIKVNQEGKVSIGGTDPVSTSTLLIYEPGSPSLSFKNSSNKSAFIGFSQYGKFCEAANRNFGRGQGEYGKNC